MSKDERVEIIPYEGNGPFNETLRKTDTWISENESRLIEQFPGLSLASAQGGHNDDPSRRVVAIMAMAENPSMVDNAKEKIEEELKNLPWPQEPPMVFPMSGTDYVKYRERYGGGGAEASEKK